MMKVAVVTHYFPTSAMPWQGHSAYQTLRELAKMCELHVFCSVAEYPALLKPKSPHKAVDLAWRPGEVNVTYIPYLALPVVSRPLNGYSIAHKVLPHVRAFDPDVILNYVIYPQGLAAVIIGKKLHVPTVLTAIGSDLNRISDPLCGLLTRQTLCRADFVTTVSHDLCLTARRMGAPPGSTRPKLNGCDTKTFYPRPRLAAREALGLDPESEVIVYVGRLDLRKGLMELVDAMAVLRRKRPKAHCYLIGDGPAQTALEAAVAKQNLGSAITFVPPRMSSEVAVWMAASNLVTLPSYNEGCPNVVIEALSSGRPVVATRVGGIPELMDERTGRMVPKQDVRALALALEQVLETHWNAAYISKLHGRSWTDVARDLLSIFQELIGRRASADWGSEA